jgi:hypothetical protein
MGSRRCKRRVKEPSDSIGINRFKVVEPVPTFAVVEEVLQKLVVVLVRPRCTPFPLGGRRGIPPPSLVDRCLHHSVSPFIAVGPTFLIFA